MGGLDQQAAKVSELGTTLVLGLAPNPTGWGGVGRIHNRPGKNPPCREMP